MDLIETSGRSPERRHPWETARAAFFMRLLADSGMLRPDTSVLDVGAGDAWLAGRLAELSNAPVTCWDAAYERTGVPPGAHPSLRFVASAPDGRFGLVLMMDVLEHVEQDHRFLAEIVADRLDTGGALLLSVPAWPALFSEHDRRLLHLRRYTPGRATALLTESGVRIVRCGGLFHSLLLPRMLQMILDRAMSGRVPPGNAGEWHHGALATSLVSGALAADTALSRLASNAGLELPGLSWWALCRRQS